MGASPMLIAEEEGREAAEATYAGEARGEQLAERFPR